MWNIPAGFAVRLGLIFTATKNYNRVDPETAVNTGLDRSVPNQTTEKAGRPCASVTSARVLCPHGTQTSGRGRANVAGTGTATHPQILHANEEHMGQNLQDDGDSKSIDSNLDGKSDDMFSRSCDKKRKLNHTSWVNVVSAGNRTVRDNPNLHRSEINHYLGTKKPLRKISKHLTTTMGYKCIARLSTDNWMFKAWSVICYGNEFEYKMIRRACCDFMVKHKQYYRVMVPAPPRRKKRNIKNDPDDFDKYIRKLKTEKGRGSLKIERLALEELYKVFVDIFPNNSMTPVKGNPKFLARKIDGISVKYAITRSQGSHILIWCNVHKHKKILRNKAGVFEKKTLGWKRIPNFRSVRNTVVKDICNMQKVPTHYKRKRWKNAKWLINQPQADDYYKAVTVAQGSNKRNSDGSPHDKPRESVETVCMVMGSLSDTPQKSLSSLS